MISFIIIAAVVYFLIVAPAGKVMAFSQRKKEATERECPECLSTIPVKASRCMYCTATVPPDDHADRARRGSVGQARPGYQAGDQMYGVVTASHSNPIRSRIGLLWSEASTVRYL